MRKVVAPFSLIDALKGNILSALQSTQSRTQTGPLQNHINSNGNLASKHRLQRRIPVRLRDIASPFVVLVLRNISEQGDFSIRQSNSTDSQAITSKESLQVSRRRAAFPCKAISRQEKATTLTGRQNSSQLIRSPL